METVAMLLGALVLGVLTMPTVILFVSFDPWSLLAMRPREVPRGVWLRTTLIVAVEAAVILVAAAWLLQLDLAPFAGEMVVFVGAWWTVRWVLRRTIWEPWRRGARGHRMTAFLLSILGPASFTMLLATTEARSDAMIAASFALAAGATFVASYPTALLLLHWIGGEHDPVSSAGYRKRP